jgi:ribosome maturation factor RimP
MAQHADQTHATTAVTGVDLAKVRAVVAPALAAHGVSLVDVEWETDRAGWVLRVTIEREGSAASPTHGVTLDDCADVSRDVSALLDADEALIPQHYHLEVSSPGIDRPLRTEADFARFAGQVAKVKLARPAPDGQRLLRGPLDAAPAGRVAVLVDGKRIEVPFADVVEARLVFEMGGQPKKKSTGRPARTP